jgi:hypothetical protein
LHDDLAARQLVGVEGVQGLAQAVEHEIGHVDDAVDRPQADGFEAAAHVLGRRADLHTLDQARGVIRTGGSVLDRDGEFLAEGLVEREIQGLQRLAERGRELASQAAVRQAVRAVGRDLDLEHVVGRAHQRADVGAEGRAFAHDPDAVVVLRETQLGARADHALALDAAELAALDLEVARQHGADAREGDGLAGGHVRRAADDAPMLAAVVDDADGELVGVGVLLLGEDLRDHDAAEGRSEVLDAGDLEAELEQGRGHLGGREPEIDMDLEPVRRDLHRIA